ncbi:MAG: glycerophosphodiester phosphodiesterase [Hyphomicrobiales bacterium]|nr:glycerophosphodiester phosphodiesterase [Hyphomicrobiales bacterium]
MAGPDWLVTLPIAHRGLHDRAQGRIENSAGAAQAALGGGYAIECDVQLTADGQAVVFHDFDLDRLTAKTGPVSARTAAELAGITLTGSADTIETLDVWLARIDGRVPVICEIKSAFDGDERLPTRAAEIARDYAGPIALKSFDPQVLVHLRRETVLGEIPLGLVAEASYEDAEWNMLNAQARRDMTALTHWALTRPDFLSWHVGDLPHAVPTLCRAMGRPVMTWTVRTHEQVETARLYADQMIFEGFTP